MSDPRAAAVVQAIRNRIAAYGDVGVALRRAAHLAKAALDVLASDQGSPATAWGATGRDVVQLNSLPPDRPLWIIGDVRGDVTALTAALAFIDEADAKSDLAFVAFLGDWTGGVVGDAACTAMVCDRFVHAPDRTLLLRGDREWLLTAEAESFRDGFGQSNGLGTMPVDAGHAPLHLELMQSLAKIAHSIPSLACLPNGVVLAHGSLPRPDRIRNIQNMDDLRGSEAALRDCVLGRLHPRDARISAGNHDGGVLLGVDDFRESLHFLSALDGRPLNRLVRGQDAAPEGFRWFKNYGEGSVLTLTTMADALPEAAGGGRRKPCIGRLKGGRIRVVRLELPEEVVRLGDQLFPRSVVPAVSTSRVEHASPRVDHALPRVDREPPRVEHTPPPVATQPRDENPAATLRSEPSAAYIHFDRGIRLLQARSWAGARDAFRAASIKDDMMLACAMNEAVACMGLGTAGHQDALSRLRELRLHDPRDAATHFNLGVAFLCGERNPSEATRSLKAAVDAAPDMSDAWWALGLAAAMRSDSAAAASAFARAADGGCTLTAPGSLHGVIPARELGPALDALRSLARYRPTPTAPPVPLAD